MEDYPKKSVMEKLLTGPFATIFASVITTFIAAGFFFKLTGPVPISVTQTTVEKQSTFDVMGEGEIITIPDEAKISLGIIKESGTVTQAQNEVNQVINQITEKLKDLDIDKDMIKTINYSINPSYDYREGRNITGYQANATLQVKFKDFDKLNQAIDIATSLGANQVDNIQFSLSQEKEDQVRKQARKQVVDQAKKKAEELAKLAGVKLGKVINVQEQTQGSYPRPVYLDSKAMGMGEAEEPTQIEPGSTQLKLQITLSYEIL